MCPVTSALCLINGGNQLQNTSAQIARLEKAAMKLAGEMNLVYIDTEIVKEPGGRFLRIYVDNESGSITLNELETFHKAIRGETDDIDYDYMEVSSPGADRPLKKPVDFERAMGLTVDLKLYTPVDGVKQFRGILSGYENGTITIDMDGTERSFEQKAVALVRPYIDVDSELEASKDI